MPDRLDTAQPEIQKDIVAGDLPGVNLVGQAEVDTPSAAPAEMPMATQPRTPDNRAALGGEDMATCPHCSGALDGAGTGWITCPGCGQTSYRAPDGQAFTAEAAPAYAKMVKAPTAALDSPLAKAAARLGEHFDMFIPIAKVDQARREVWGYAAVEEADRAGQIMDYETSLPHFQKWSADTMQRSGGKSLGNVREMHEPHAAGKLIEFKPDGARKGVWIGAKVMDDSSWQKVEGGVLTGFSVGGDYGPIWHDRSNPRLERYTALPSEVSLVDSPCIPSATFQMVKGDGTVEQRLLKGAGLGERVPLEKAGGWPTVPAEAPKDVQGVSVERVPDPMTVTKVNAPGGEKTVGTASVSSPSAAGQVAAANAPTHLNSQASSMVTATSTSRTESPAKTQPRSTLGGVLGGSGSPRAVKVRQARMVKVRQLPLKLKKVAVKREGALPHA